MKFAVCTEDHSRNDCFMVVVMTHGCAEGKLMAYDKTYNEEILWEYFTNGHCPSLIGKPKLFFVQSCRGENLDLGLSCESQTDSIEKLPNEITAVSPRVEAVDLPGKYIPSNADLVIMHSTQQGYVSVRGEHEGTWFIQELCKALRKLCDSKKPVDLLRCLTKVNNQVSKYTDQAGLLHQIPELKSHLTRNLLLKRKHNYELVHLPLPQESPCRGGEA